MGFDNRSERPAASWLLLLLATLAAAALPSPAAALNSTLYSSIVTAVEAQIVAAPASAATMVRLSFHDCLGANGCDGCVNTNLQDNAGLAGVMTTLDGFYNGAIMRLTTSDISRADLFALAGLTAASYSAKKGSATLPSGLNSAYASTTFTWGRTDCATSPLGTETAAEFPSGLSDGPTTIAFLTSRFGLSSDQAVALLGAHSLGKASRANSGFTSCSDTTRPSAGGTCAALAASGQWVGANTVLSNDYHDQVLQPWSQFKLAASGANPDLYAWAIPSANAGQRSRLMLNSDIGLARTLTITGSAGQVNGQSNTAPTRAAVQQYSNDNALFLTDFAASFNLMIKSCGRGSSGTGYTPCSSLKAIDNTGANSGGAAASGGARWAGLSSAFAGAALLLLM